ncbi:MAG: permease-like cell division protein FtsX [Clostridium sp.]|nr:permease-like cell division protein FtsX [Clostridium sp.]MCM1444665.1 permease-like cell division protein FtsX [Candidatus Amulumruptor caecigallinarius]
MKAIRIFGRNIRDAFKSVFRNFSLSIASISCITITLIVVSIAVILSYNVNNFTRLVEEDVTIVVFLDKTTTEETALEYMGKINLIDGVDRDHTEFKSKVSIAEDMMESSDVYNNIMGEWKTEDGKWQEDEIPLQPTIQVKVTSLKHIDRVADEIGNLDLNKETIKLIQYGEDMVRQLISLFDVIRKISIGVVAALILVTSFLISNTIKITIFSRKREIEIMRLVGASNTNIKVPFICEGLFLGIFGSIIPILVTTYGYVGLFESFNGQLFSPFIRLVTPEPFIYIVSGILLVIGMLVGMFGSYLAVRKHLKI